MTLRFKNLEYLFDKIDIVGLSSGNLKKIFDGGFTTVKSIFEMTKADFMKIDGFKGKMADKLFDGLLSKKNNIDCVLLMNASNTLGRGMGSRKIKLITDIYPAIISNNYIPSITELVQIKGIEEKTAQLFITNLPKFIEFKKLNGLDCLIEDKKPVQGQVQVQGQGQVQGQVKVSFKDLIFVFTGFRSKILEDFITANGGKVNTSISSKTSFVIRKDNEESTKVDKANDLGIKLVNLSDFEKEYNIKAK
jgi:DNA ligase (NAD+)